MSVENMVELYARQNKLRLGKDERTGLYFIEDPTSTVQVFGRRVAAVSKHPYLTSAMHMMREYVRNQNRNKGEGKKND